VTFTTNRRKRELPMARFELNIDYPLEKMEKSRQRLEARNRFRYIDRVPIQFGLWGRYFTPIFKYRYLDFFGTSKRSTSGCCSSPSTVSKTSPRTSAWSRSFGCIRFLTTSFRPAPTAARWAGWKRAAAGRARHPHRRADGTLSAGRARGRPAGKGDPMVARNEGTCRGDERDVRRPGRPR